MVDTYPKKEDLKYVKNSKWKEDKRTMQKKMAMIL